MKLLLLFFLLTNYSISHTIWPDDPDYNVENISPELKEDAIAIVRSYSEIFDLKSVDRAVLSVKYAITVMDKNGDGYALFNAFYDKFRNINNIKASLYDQNGDRIEKVKSSDIKDYSAASGYSIFEDSRQKYYKPQVKDYPFTVEYEYEIEYNGILNYPSWYPVVGFDVAVEHSEFKIIVPLDLGVRFKSNNIKGDPFIEDEERQRAYYWEINNFPAMEHEAHSPFFTDISPSVITAPNSFKIEGYEGNMDSWQQFGFWVNNLLKGRDIIPEETRIKINGLVEGVDDEMEKTRKIYEYVQSNTRYVSIQEGIGGWQPFPASDVDNTGYGDCKALTNYTMALLRSVGINSFYTKVRAGRNVPNMKKDFVSNQSNHAILCVPVERDTIWLECTSQTDPFGYIGNSTDDRDVLIITDEGGKVVHTKVYKQTDNLQYRKAEVVLDNNGSGSASITTMYTGLQFDNVSGVLEESYEKQEKWLYNNIDIVNFNLQKFSYSVDEDIVPVATEKLELKLNNYASTMGKRLFVPLNLLNKATYVPPRIEDRKTDIVLTFPYFDIDTVEYHLPQDYTIESKPDNTSFTTEFGEYSSEISIDNNRIIYVRKRKMNKGLFPSDSYDNFIDFYKKIVKADKADLVLVKTD